MREDPIRDQVAGRLAAADATLPTSALRRPVHLVAGLARASSRWLARTARGRAGDIEAESAIASSLGELKGVTMKMGQMLAYADFGLPKNLTSALSALHTHAQPLPFDRIRALLDAELGAAGRVLGAAMQPRAIAAGSLGQVHRSTLPDGTPVAVKVLYPGIADTIARDLAPATLSSRLATWISPRVQLHTWVREVHKRVLEECDYRLEARRQQRFAGLFADHPAITVPALHSAWCSERVLTTGFVDGLHLDAYLASAPAAGSRQRAGEALFDFYIGSLVEHGLYNCDPHPGNYLFTDGGRVAFIDFGSGRELGREVMDRMWALLSPMLRDEVSGFDALGGVPLAEVMRRALDLGISAELPLLLRTLLGVSSVLARLGARANWYRRLRPFAAPVTVVPVPVVAAPVDAIAPVDSIAPVVPLVVEAPLLYDIVLLAPGDSPIAVVRAIRDLTGMALRDVRDLIDTRGGLVQHAVPRADAERVRERLQSAGARIELRLTSG